MENEAGDTNEVSEEAAEDTEEEGVKSEQKTRRSILGSICLTK